MSKNLVISAQNVGKMYPLYGKPRDRLKQSLWHALPAFLRRGDGAFFREFWALRGVSFEIGAGETVGIVGRNGSGKSTLLQIIAGITAPTQGELIVKGQVAALLELGSGFDPEFTGRENVYLNGSIWGLSRSEIDAIFDDIAAFADIGQFMEQPVKHYSSGMFVRLAFAVQTFVPKEIFVVDEALAVGDTAFQRKCLASLEQFKENGGTVLLVSHDTQTIVRQCERCLLLHQGELIVDAGSKPATDLFQKLMFSTPQRIIEILAEARQNNLQSNSGYVARNTFTSKPNSKLNGIFEKKDSAINDRPKETTEELEDWLDPNLPQPNESIYGNGAVKIFDSGMYTLTGNRVNVLVAGQRYQWKYRVQFYQDAQNIHFGMMLKTVDGLDAASIASFREQVYFDFISTGSVYEVTFELSLNVVPGDYFLNSGVGGRIGKEHIYLQRRVDHYMVRVIPPDSRDSHGVAYVSPQFSYVCEVVPRPSSIGVEPA